VRLDDLCGSLAVLIIKKATCMKRLAINQNTIIIEYKVKYTQKHRKQQSVPGGNAANLSSHENANIDPLP